MRKFLTLFIAVIMAISVFAVSACGGNDNNGKVDGDPTTPPVIEEKGVSGSIEGNYNAKVELDAENANYQLLATKLSGDIHPVVKDETTAGGTAQAEAEIKLTVGDKSLTVSLKDMLSLILDVTKMEEDGLDAITGLSNKAKLSVKSDEGFGTALTDLADKLIAMDLAAMEVEEDPNAEKNAQIKAVLAMLDNLDFNAAVDAYVKDTNVYLDAKASGIPEAVKAMDPTESFDFDALKAGLKYKFSEDDIKMMASMFGGMFGGQEKYPDNGDYYPEDDDISLQAAKFEQDLPEDTGSEPENGNEVDTSDLSMVMGIASMVGAEIYADISDNGIKIKIATTAETKTIVSGFISAFMPAKTKEVITNIVISKLDIELYAAINADNEITAIAGKIDVAVSATVADTTVSLAVNGALDLSFDAPATIEFPSFDGYVDFMEVMASQGQDNGDEGGLEAA